MMVTPNIPTDQPTTIQVQGLQPSEVSEVLQRDNTSDFIKRLVLGYHINQVIQDNEAHNVRTGVYIVDLKSNKPFVSHNTDAKHFAASINKLPVVWLVLQDIRNGQLSLDQTMTWAASDVRAGAGVYDQPGAPTQAKLKDVIFDLLNRSGNTAVRILVNQGLGGAAAVNARLAEIPELSNTRLQPLDANRFYLGDSTAHDSLWVMTELMKKQDAPAAFMKDALKTNIWDDMGVRSQLAGNDYITLVNKVGLLDDADGNNRHDTGIIYNTRTKRSYAYSFFTTSPYDDAEATPQADKSLKDMGRYTLRFSGDKKHHQQVGQGFRAEGQSQRETRVLY